jgi:hypothetical protein
MAKIKIGECIVTLEHPKAKKPIRITVQQLIDEIDANGEIEG